MARWLSESAERMRGYHPPVLETAQSHLLDALEALAGIEDSYRTRAVRRALHAAWSAVQDGREDLVQTEVSSGS